MKQLPLIGLIIMLLTAGFANAQKSVVFLHGAASFPIADYGAVSGNGSGYNRNSGYATTGFMSEIGFSYNFAKHWGAELKLMHAGHPVDENAIINTLRIELNPNLNYGVSYDNWDVGAFLLGAHYIFPFSKSNFQIQLLFGVLGKGETNYTISSFDYVNGYFSTLNGKTESASGFAGCFGLQYELDLSPNIGIDFLYQSIAADLEYGEQITNLFSGYTYLYS